MIPDTIPRVYWRTVDVGQMLGLRSSTIRFWCQELGIEPKKRARNTRYFSVDDLAKLKEAQRLIQVERYTLEGARMKMRERFT